MILMMIFSDLIMIFPDLIYSILIISMIKFGGMTIPREIRRISVATFMGVAAGSIAITRHALKSDGAGCLEAGKNGENPMGHGGFDGKNPWEMMGRWGNQRKTHGDLSWENPAKLFKVFFKGVFNIIRWVWINTYENTIFSGLFTSRNPSYFWGSLGARVP